MCHTFQQLTNLDVSASSLPYPCFPCFNSMAGLHQYQSGRGSQGGLIYHRALGNIEKTNLKCYFYFLLEISKYY